MFRQKKRFSPWSGLLSYPQMIHKIRIPINSFECVKAVSCFPFLGMKIFQRQNIVSLISLQFTVFKLDQDRLLNNIQHFVQCFPYLCEKTVAYTLNSESTFTLNRTRAQITFKTFAMH